MTPPGLAFASVSERARERAPTASNPRFSLDWERALGRRRRARRRSRRPSRWCRRSTSHSQTIEAEGLEARFARTVRLGRGVRAGFRALGLQLFSPDRDDCSLVTAALWPPGIDGEAIRRALRDRHGITVAGGQGELDRAGSCGSARSARSRPATSCAAWRRSRSSCSRPATCSSWAPASGRSRAPTRHEGPRHGADRSRGHRAAARGGRGRRRDRPGPRPACCAGSATTTRSIVRSATKVDAELIGPARACA